MLDDIDLNEIIARDRELLECGIRDDDMSHAEVDRRNMLGHINSQSREIERLRDELERAASDYQSAQDYGDDANRVIQDMKAERDRLKTRVAELTGLLQTGAALFETDDEAQQPGTDAYTWRVQTDAALAQETKP